MTTGQLCDAKITRGDLSYELPRQSSTKACLSLLTPEILIVPRLQSQIFFHTVYLSKVTHSMALIPITCVDDT
jgi:hypothetical protein